MLIKTAPYKIHTILTDNGVQFVQRDQGSALGWIGHIFGRVCAQNGNIPPAEAEERYYAMLDATPMAA
ncbi:hypothetical protein GCM10023219_25700 [Stakelama sediminis]|uniref:Integrase catalytic domain-containing protein n=1 Tax=Stakelama sediminis TaxID=463200 RepID=A0A840YYZ9_9SPHN|nr:hypothetical protein [Stakelama sediminis]MBB5718750.1 hypothetical protein [Stakelama sediminis]